MKKIQCSKCNTWLPEDANYCSYCGSPVSLKKCKKCGEPVEATYNYCLYCGTKLDSSNVVDFEEDNKENIKKSSSTKKSKKNKRK